MSFESHSLTHSAAQERSAAITLHSYSILLDLRRAAASNSTFPVTVDIDLESSTNSVALDYLGNSLTSVVVNNAAVEVNFEKGLIDVPLTPGKRSHITINAFSEYSTSGQGLHRFVDPVDDATYVYSHSEPSDARRIFPCFDQPDMKAPIKVIMIVPAEWVALSNGEERKIITHDGLSRVEFEVTKPISTYLTAFVAGPFQSLQARAARVDLRLWARASMAKHLDEEFLGITAQGLEYFQEHFGPYPWGKYDSVLVPEYNLGAMENPGLVTFNENYLFHTRVTRAQRAQRAVTILHEMSHMWFGDLVTPRWWDDLWLKESFAEFMGTQAAAEATEYSEAWANFTVGRKDWAFAQDQLPTTHPIIAEVSDVDAARQNFDGITYAKGAAVITQLVHTIGLEAFFAGARDFFTRHAYSSANFSEFLDALAPHTSVYLHAWAQIWLHTSGPDRLEPHIQDSTLSISRTGSRLHRLDVGFYRDGCREASADLHLDSDTATVEVPAHTDLILLNDTAQTYALSGIDSASLAWLETGLSSLEDETARAVAWSSLWNLTRDGALAVSTYVGIALAHAPREVNPAVTARVLNTALSAARDYADSEEEVTRLGRRLWASISGAQPGSDAQLVLARAAIDALSDAHLEEAEGYVRSVLAGAIPGLGVDEDLRWRAWTALAARGAATPAELEVELKHNSTLNTQNRYLQAIWSLPGKKAELYALVQQRHWSNAQVDALLAAFAAPGAAAERAEIAPQYWSDIEPWWQGRSIEMATRLLRGLYPDTEDTGARTEEVLTRPLPQALRRVLLELQDAWARRQRVRQMNARLT